MPQNITIVYRQYANLTVYILIDKDSESHLAVLDLIQFVVQVLDKQFGNNVVELDLIFNPDKVIIALDEIIMDGVLINTDLDQVTH